MLKCTEYKFHLGAVERDRKRKRESLKERIYIFNNPSIKFNYQMIGHQSTFQYLCHLILYYICFYYYTRGK